jgi:hypothetical protein
MGRICRKRPRSFNRIIEETKKSLSVCVDYGAHLSRLTLDYPFNGSSRLLKNLALDAGFAS